MRTQPKPTPAKAQAPAQPAFPFTFICTACETVEHRRTPALPEHWALEEIGHDLYAYCPGCAIDLPRRCTGKGAVQ